MKVVYLGSDVFLSSFLYLAENHDILALYTYHEDEDYFTEYAIVKEAGRRGIPVHYEDLTQEDIVRLMNEGCQLFFAAEYNRILPIPQEEKEFRGINIHSSLLPQGRGYYPIESALERGLSRTGVTMHKMAAQLDVGEILFQQEIPVGTDADSVDLYLRCSGAALEMTKALTEDLEGWFAKGKTQRSREPYWQRPNPQRLRLCHNMTVAQAAEVFHRFNQMTEVELEGEMYYVCAMNTGQAPLFQEVIPVGPLRYLYQVKDGHLRLVLQPEGKEARTL